ncbi:MAG: methyltransferase domain-containing protein [Phycisphaerae bacterium]|nr:methyltransferase domain-containing protein [Phycisphaerae bacterium]
MNIAVTQRDRCRICGSSAVRRFLDFPDYPFSDNLLESPRSERECLARYQAFWCPDCRTAQNLTDFDWSTYYATYNYTVSASEFARNFMERLAENTLRQYDLPPGSAVVEVGSSDGYQLACFKERGMNVFGYEPGRGLAAAAEQRGVPTTTALFTRQTLAEIPADLRPVQVFLSLYTCDHMPDPLASLEAMRSALDPQRGLVIIEVHDLEQIIARREACLFCHEHTVYLSRSSLARLMERAGLKLVSVALVPEAERRGNSLLAVGVHRHSPLEPRLPPPTEQLRALDDWNTYRDFAAAVETAHANLAAYVRSRLSSGARLAGYGASGRAISTLALAGLTDAEIAYVCDANPSLHGLYLPKSHVPIRPPRALLDEPVDEVIVFAYGYMREIRAELEPFIERGGRLTSLLELLRG